MTTTELRPPDRPTPPLRDPATLATGAAGVLAIVTLFGWIASSASGPDVTSTGAAGELARWLGARSAGDHAVGHLAFGVLTYVPLIVFLAGLHRFVRRLDVTGLAASVVGIASAMFLAGALAGDIAGLALGLSQATSSAFGGTADLAIVLDRMWLIALMEANVALGVLIGSVAVASLAARRAGNPLALPGWLSWWGVVAALAVVPLAVGATNLAVFIGSNQLRLLWILAAGIVLIARGRRSPVA